MSRLDLPNPQCRQLHFTSFTLCVLLCVTSVVQCSDITFTSSPSSIKTLVTDSLALRCGVTDGAPTGTSGIVGKRDISKRDVKTSDIVHVSSIHITKNNVDVAAVTAFVAAKVFNKTGGVHVTGKMTASGAEQGFLQVTWDYPDSSLSGSYQCIVTGYDVDGHLHTLTETVDVDDNEVTLNDVVSYIHQLKLDNELQKLINDHQKQVIEQQTTDITQLKGEISTLQKSNADLTTKVDTKVIFSAYLSSSVTVSSADVLVFDKLRTSIGGGYSNTSGIFTSPCSGYYVFELHIFGQKDKHAEFVLHHNNNVVSRVWADDGFDYNSASNSVVLLLQKGDTVKVTSTGASDPYGSSCGQTSLSCYLITSV